jgi:hypothetical protein
MIFVYILYLLPFIHGENIKFFDVNTQTESEFIEENPDYENFRMLFPKTPLANLFITDLAQKIGFDNAINYYSTKVKDGTMPVSKNL